MCNNEEDFGMLDEVRILSENVFKSKKISNNFEAQMQWTRGAICEYCVLLSLKFPYIMVVKKNSIYIF